MRERSRSAAVAVIGGGLAGCEAAMAAARCGVPVDLFEMKPARFSPAHQSEALGELVCSNSLGGEGPDSAPGLLKLELKSLESVVIEAAAQARVPAGKALAVDRVRFAEAVTAAVGGHPLIRVIRGECDRIPDGYGAVVVATGPLTSDALAGDLERRIGSGTLYFYDSISPIVTAESVDYTRTYFGSRYTPGADDYLNCPMDRTTYERFVDAIGKAEKVPLRAFEAMRCFEACLPIEMLAERGIQTLAFGPMKPVGLEDPRTGRRPHAVVQLRRENVPTTLYNLVGFQTRMKRGAQKEVFRMIPGLESAEFARFGSMHRNTYVDSPKVLRPDLSLGTDPKVFIAGQITGVEGYVESAGMGLWAGLGAAGRMKNFSAPPPPRETALGSLLHAVTTPPLHGAFAPMNINFGLFPPADSGPGGKDTRRRRIVERARESARLWRAGLEEICGFLFAARAPGWKGGEYAEPVF